MLASASFSSADPSAVVSSAELRRDLMNWAEPVIADRILDCYRGFSLGLERTRALAGQHRRLWRAAILDRHPDIEEIRYALHHELAGSGITADVAEAIDDAVIEELIDIVLKRFRASARQSKAFSMILLGIATRIGETRAHAVN